MWSPSLLSLAAPFCPWGSRFRGLGWLAAAPCGGVLSNDADTTHNRQRFDMYSVVIVTSNTAPENKNRSVGTIAEWPRIRQALRTSFPDAPMRTEWQHQTDSVTSLPTGITFAASRGAGLGDVLGTMRCALVLGDVRDVPLHEFLSSPLEAKGVCDEWFVDGRASLRPALVLGQVASGPGCRPRLLRSHSRLRGACQELCPSSLSA